ncbi:MAG: hypothetical protein ACTTH5_04635 [Wolinella sp.]
MRGFALYPSKIERAIPARESARIDAAKDERGLRKSSVKAKGMHGNLEFRFPHCFALTSLLLHDSVFCKSL